MTFSFSRDCESAPPAFLDRDMPGDLPEPCDKCEAGGWKSTPDLSIEEDAVSGVDLLDVTAPEAANNVLDDEHENLDELLGSSQDCSVPGPPETGDGSEVPVVPIESDS